MTKKIISIILCVLMLVTVIPFTVFADNVKISTVDLLYDEGAATFNTGYTEGECKDSIRANCSVETVGVEIDDFSLSVQSSDGTDWWGIGDGTSMASYDKTYAMRVILDLKNGYDWIDVMKSDELKHSVADFPEFTVNFNGEKRTDVWFCYNASWNSIVFYIPIGHPSTNPCIKSVTLTEKNLSVAVNSSHQFETVVEGTSDNKNIVWQIFGNNSDDTVISNSGMLFVAADETATELTVRATSEFDFHKYDEATVTVTLTAPTIDAIEFVNPSENVYKGNNKTFTVIITGTQANKNVNFALQGDESANTTVSEAFNYRQIDETTTKADVSVYISNDETATTIYLWATSVADNTKSAYAIINVMDTEKYSRVDLTYDENAVKFKLSDTEGYARNKATEVAAVTTADISLDNLYLMYKLESWNGIGDGTNTVDKNKNYALEYTLEIKGNTHDWPNALKADSENHLITEVEGFEIYVNGKKRTDVEFKYNKYWNYIFVYVPADIILNGFLTEDGKTYYYIDGEPVTSKLMTIDGKKYYFGKDGAMYTKRLISVSGKKYYMGADGAAYTKKLISVDGKKYYMGADGVAYTSKLISVSGKKYYMGKDGVAYTKRLISVGGKKYYMGADGVAYTSKLISVDGKKYYMGKDGVAYKSKLISVSGKKYYIGKDCIAYKSKFASLSGKKYYFGSDCVMYKSKTFSVSGVKWRADSNGVCKKV